jgi:hypothetical protein
VARTEPAPWLRMLLALSAFLGSYLILFLLLMVVVPLGQFDWLGAIGAFLGAVAAGRYVWRHPQAGAGSVGGSMARGALVCGGLGFAAGFFGPMLFAPDANQGPLLGLLITGPAGIAGGAVAGLLYGLMRSRSE